MVLKLVVVQPLCSRHSERAAFAAEEKIAAIGSKKRELFFGKAIDVMLQVPCGCPLSVPPDADVEIAAGIGLAARTQLFRPMWVRRRATSGRGEDQQFLVR